MSERPQRIRVIAICACADGDRFLVGTGGREEIYYRPLGGGVEPGERAHEAIRREFREEIGAELENVDLVGVIENLFREDNGSAGHQIVFVFRGTLADPSKCAGDHIEWEGETRALWVPIEDFKSGARRLVPDGLRELLGLAR